MTEKGAALVDRALYLPYKEWAQDAARREEAGVPEEVHFASKGELAKEMFRRAFEAGVPARWQTRSMGRLGAYEGGSENGESGTFWRCLVKQIIPLDPTRAVRVLASYPYGLLTLL